MDKQQSLSKISKELMLREPYYGFFLIMLNKMWRKDLPTAGVSKNGINYQLAINEEFWTSLSEKHQMGLLKHELLHIAFGHLVSFGSFRNKLVKERAYSVLSDKTSLNFLNNRRKPSRSDFNEVIRPTVQQNGQRIAVPVIYGAPERWKSAQKDGYYKDKNGKIMAPIIMFKRDTVERNNSITNKLDANQPHLYATWTTTYNSKNTYSNFDLLNNRKPVKTYQLIVIPDYVNLSYSCTIQTYYVDQLNKIVEAVNYASDSYWGDPERFKFKASIDTFTTSTELNDGQDRIVKATFTLKLSGYIVPDNIQKDLAAHRKFNSKAQVIIKSETFISGGPNT